ncbi:hypothetical protein ACS0TY_022137 [Phlomoides rotata]
MEVVTEVGSEVIEVDNIEGEKESCLVGRLVTEKHWNPSTLIEAITKVWQPKHGMSSRNLGDSKMILFCFDDIKDRDWVLKNQPWHFKGYLFAIKAFSGRNEQQLPSSVNVNIEHASFWARLYDVPVSCMNESSLRLFTKQIGVLESVDKSVEDLVGKLLRFKVSVDITKPLLRGITVRVKWKHLWLPLKYESLPIYCFSCGTIGHDHKNCQSYNRNFKFRTCKLRASSSKKTKKFEQDAPATLPHDIVEIILLHVPFKDLLRFKVVSKQWKALISDPKFADIHFQLYKNSSSRNLLAWYDSFDLFHSGFKVAELQKNQFKFISKIKHKIHVPHGCDLKCYCDGLYLIRLKITLGKTYVMCNPSCRVDKEIHCPIKIDDSDSSGTLYGIYYHPLMMDYKVVIGDMKYYAVFSCRDNKWSEVKDMKGIFRSGEVSCFSGVSFNGSLYWLETKRVTVGHLCELQIVCFDGEDENFKKLAGPDCRADKFYLNSSRCHLCLFYNNGDNEMMIMKRVKGDEKDSWMEFKVQLRTSPQRQYVKTPSPICWVSEDEIILGDIGHGNYYMICDLSKNSVVIRKNPFRLLTSHPVPYLENLFLL